MTHMTELEYLKKFNQMKLQTKLDNRLVCPCQHNLPMPCVKVGASLLCELDADDARRHIFEMMDRM